MANTDSYIDFLKVLYRKYGKVLLFADNTSYHKTGRVKELLKELKGDIVICYFPPYTPELNPIEIQWRENKKGIANQFFSGCFEMKDSLRKVLRKKEVKIAKLFDYLTL